MFKNVELVHSKVYIQITTIFGSDLEFVLDTAEIRNNKQSGFYYEKLVDIVTRKLKDSHYELEGYQVYGDIILEIGINDTTKLKDLMNRVNNCVNKWTNIYKIEKFKK